MVANRPWWVMAVALVATVLMPPQLATAGQEILTADGVRLVLADGWKIDADEPGRLRLLGPDAGQGVATAVVTLRLIEQMDEIVFLEQVEGMLGAIDPDARGRREARDGVRWLRMEVSWTDDDGGAFRSFYAAALLESRGTMVQLTAPGEDYSGHAKAFVAMADSFRLSDPDPDIPRWGAAGVAGEPPAPGPVAAPGDEAGAAAETEAVSEPQAAPTVSVDERGGSWPPDDALAPAPAAVAEAPAVPAAVAGPEPVPGPSPVVESDPQPREPEAPAVRVPARVRLPAPPSAPQQGTLRVEQLRVERDSESTPTPSPEGVVFAPGDVVRIRLRPVGARLNGRGEQWLEAGVALLDADGEVLLDEQRLVEHLGRPPARPLALTLVLRIALPESMAAGDYRIAVTLTDRLDEFKARVEAPLRVVSGSDDCQ